MPLPLIIFPLLVPVAAPEAPINPPPVLTPPIHIAVTTSATALLPPPRKAGDRYFLSAEAMTQKPNSDSRYCFKQLGFQGEQIEKVIGARVSLAQPGQRLPVNLLMEQNPSFQIGYWRDRKLQSGKFILQLGAGAEARSFLPSNELSGRNECRISGKVFLQLPALNIPTGRHSHACVGFGAGAEASASTYRSFFSPKVQVTLKFTP